MTKAVLSIAVLVGVSLLFSTPVASQKSLPSPIYIPETGGISGNVAEWCEDIYVRDYHADGADESAATNGTARVIRGGSWLDPPDLYRMAKRFGFAPQGRRDFIGFRVVMKVGHEKAQKAQKG
ncbi:MAG TPA: SUMF1/EgtB/PvdO family nonheme iron enzyme [Pyrinomonadaceae bacterium]|nr:SUMF1/EgtB/PvdO family nonheme iron enzyme [Pyrinomonadaceae bacterium]